MKQNTAIVVFVLIFLIWANLYQAWVSVLLKAAFYSSVISIAAVLVLGKLTWRKLTGRNTTKRTKEKSITERSAAICRR